MKEYQVGKISILQNDHDETPPIELPLEKPLWVTKKIDPNERIRAEPTSFNKLRRGIEIYFPNKRG